MSPEIKATIDALLALGLDIKKGLKAANKMEGVIEMLIADPAVLMALKNVIVNINQFPAEIKAFGLSEALELVPGVIEGIKNIVDA